MKLYIGCPIWAHKAWVGGFFPAGTKPAGYLAEYARRLTTVEGNTTFYATPSEQTVREWAAVVPRGFRFCFKIPRAVSHAGRLEAHIAAARGFVDWMRPLGANLGPMFLQLPPNYPPAALDDLVRMLEAWPAGIRLAVEVRHPGWFDEPSNRRLNDLLARLGMARVVIDTRPIRDLQGDRILAGSVYERLLQARRRKPDVPVLPERTTSFIFMRFIGHPRPEINDPLIEEWTDFLAAQAADAPEAYVFCHCPDETFSPGICRRFYARAAEKLTLPPLPWDDAAGDPAQLRLF